MTPDQIQTALKRWNVCTEARQRAEGKDLAAIYACERGDWLYWLLPRIKAPKNVCVQLAVDAARLLLPHAGDLHSVCLAAIEAAEAWLLDPSKANVARCKAAGKAASRAAAAASAWAAAAWAAAACAAAARAAAYAAAASAAAYAAADDLSVALANCFRARIPYAEFVSLFTKANQ